ncbi:MAG: hypothetical protein JSU00_05765 [Acidobacteria bacterium]|nr:hypothetical protein [Acidobacteriota bacterium]
MGQVVFGFILAAVFTTGPKPQCKASNQGEFWPTAANADPTLRRAFMQDGSLEMCAAKMWRYTWQPVVVNVNNYRKRPAK